MNLIQALVIRISTHENICKPKNTAAFRLYGCNEKFIVYEMHEMWLWYDECLMAGFKRKEN
jgi:hypothetical protein